MTHALSILGSTGSIGRQSLDVAEHLQIPVVALAAGTNVERMAEQCRHFHPKLAAMADAASAQHLREELNDPSVHIVYGEEGLMACAAMDEADTVITAVVGTLGLKPTLEAIRRGKRIGLANKETMVCAGELVMEQARRYGAEIIPVDSEHSAIFQCLMGNRDRQEVKNLILTCSGGPFFGMSREQVAKMTKADALRHPNWKMGAKITIDCATLMNKGLEVIEAMRLYRLPVEQVKVVIHRQSVVHSLVEFCDGAVMAQLGVPDMRLPIQLAMTYPQRMPSPVASLDLLSCGDLSFHAPDLDTFECLAIALEAAKQGGTLPAIMNAANEVAVGLFLENKIGFLDIPRLVRLAMAQVPCTSKPTLEQILSADSAAREAVRQAFEK